MTQEFKQPATYLYCVLKRLLVMETLGWVLNYCIIITRPQAKEPAQKTTTC